MPSINPNRPRPRTGTRLARFFGLVSAAGLLWAAWAGEVPRWRLAGSAMVPHAGLPPLIARPLGPGPGGRIFCLGDSNTAGNRGPAGEGGRRGYPAWLREHLRGIPVLVFARGGARASDIPLPDPLPRAGDFVILMAGTNDAAPRGWLRGRSPTPPDRFEQNLQAMAARLGENGAAVLVLAPLPGGSTAIEARLAPYRLATRRAAGSAGAAFADPQAAFAGMDAALLHDALHLRPAAQEALARWLAGMISYAPQDGA